MSCILSLVPTDPVLDYPVCGKDLLTGSIEAVAHYEYMHMYPIPESDNVDQTQYMTVTDAELEVWLRSLEAPTAPQAFNEYVAPIPHVDTVPVECETTLKGDNSQDLIRSGTMEPVMPSSSIVPKTPSHEDIVLVAGMATCKFNYESECKTTRAKSSSGRRTGGKKEGLQSQLSKRNGGCRRADSGGSGERVMRRGYRTDMALDAGEKPPTKRRRDDDIDEEGSTSRVGKRNRTH